MFHTYLLDQYQNIFKGVEFISTTDTSEAIYGKPYIKINAILDIAKQQNSDCVCLINSVKLELMDLN